MKKWLLAIAALVLFIAVAAIGRSLPADASVEGATWTHAAQHYPYIIVENDAPGWHVKKAAHAWGSFLHVGRCSSNPKAHCVKVRRTYDKHRFDVGVTNMVMSGGRMYSANIVMNDYYGSSYSERLEGTTHELGHALGLGHDRRGGVMNPVDDARNVRPSAYERNELRKLYLKKRVVEHKKTIHSSDPPIMHL